MKFLRLTLFPCLVIMLLVGVAAAPVTAAQDDKLSPLSVVQTTVDGVIEILRDTEVNDSTRKRQVKTVIGKNFDFSAMSYRVMATNWGKAMNRWR